MFLFLCSLSCICCVISFFLESIGNIETCQSDEDCSSKLVVIIDIPTITASVGKLIINKAQTSNGISFIEPWELQMTKSNVNVEYTLEYVQSVKETVDEIYNYASSHVEIRQEVFKNMLYTFLPLNSLLGYLKTDEYPEIKSSCIDYETTTTGAQDTTCPLQESTTETDSSLYVVDSQGGCCFCALNGQEFTKITGSLRAPDSYCVSISEDGSREFDKIWSEACVAARTDRWRSTSQWGLNTGDTIKDIRMFVQRTQSFSFEIDVVMSRNGSVVESLSVGSGGSRAAIGSESGVQVELVGSYATSVTPPDLTSLFIGLDAGSSLLDSWFVVPQSLANIGASGGNSCNRLGVSHSTFRTKVKNEQPCESYNRRDCLTNQPRELLTNDAARVNQQYLVNPRGSTHIGALQIPPVLQTAASDTTGDSSPSNLLLAFNTSIHMSKIRVEITAENLTMVVRSATLLLSSAYVSTFQALRETGVLQTTILNAGSTSALGLLLVNNVCTYLSDSQALLIAANDTAAVESARMPTSEIQTSDLSCFSFSGLIDAATQQTLVNLNPGQQADFSISINALQDAASFNRLTVEIIDAYTGNTFDSLDVEFSVSSLLRSAQDQDGLLGDGVAVTGSSVSSSSDVNETKGIQWWGYVLIFAGVGIICCGFWWWWRKRKARQMLLKKKSSRVRKHRKINRKQYDDVSERSSKRNFKYDPNSESDDDDENELLKKTYREQRKKQNKLQKPLSSSSGGKIRKKNRDNSLNSNSRH